MVISPVVRIKVGTLVLTLRMHFRFWWWFCQCWFYSSSRKWWTFPTQKRDAKWKIQWTCLIKTQIKCQIWPKCYPNTSGDRRKRQPQPPQNLLWLQEKLLNRRNDAETIKHATSAVQYLLFEPDNFLVVFLFRYHSGENLLWAIIRLVARQNRRF